MEVYIVRERHETDWSGESRVADGQTCDTAGRGFGVYINAPNERDLWDIVFKTGSDFDGPYGTS